ncbi:MAG: cytidylate kinase-like family protein [Anaerolineae bacterium]|nr:cytidylate kinase-like family protein [Anaerolineae bacterium]
MSVITVSRELGSEGSYIARKTAMALGYHLVDKKVIENILAQYGLVHFNEEYESSTGIWDRFDASRERTVEMLNRVIRAVAHHGNVIIVGRGSFAVLSGFADVLNVRIQAPLPVRVERVMMERSILDRDQVELLVKESDRVRQAFISSWYGVRWDSAVAFDLVIDTGKVPREMAVDWLVALHYKLEKQNGNHGLFLTGSLEVDTVLMETVQSVLQKVMQ